MAVNSHHIIIISHCSSTIPTSLPQKRSFLFPKPPSRPRRGGRAVSASMGAFTEFPYLPEAQRNMMADLVSTVETRLDGQLAPCALPDNVRRYGSPDGASQAGLHIRSGNNSSQVDFILGSWIHSELPPGAGALDIASLSGYLKPSTDAPNFVLDAIQSGPTTLILLLDLKPRKELALYPDYLHTFYEATELEAQRLALVETPEVKPYFSPSLYIRSILSPTAIMVRVEAETAQKMEAVVADRVHPVAKEVLRVCLDECACAEREVSAAERELLQKIDGISKKKSIEVELSASLPRLFGPETAKRVIDVMSQYFFA